QNASGSFSLTSPAGTFSSGTHTYVAFVAYDGADFGIDSVSLDLFAATGWMHLSGDSGACELTDCALDPSGNLWSSGTDDGNGSVPPKALLLCNAPDGTPLLQRSLSFDATTGAYGNCV